MHTIIIPIDFCERKIMIKKIFSYVSCGVFVSLFLFGISNAMQNPKKICFPENSVWKKVGLTVKKHFTDGFYFAGEHDDEFLDKFNGKYNLYEAELTELESIVLVMAIKAFDLRPTTVKAKFGPGVKYFIDCTGLQVSVADSDVREKIEKKQNKIDKLKNRLKNEIDEKFNAFQAMCNAGMESLIQENNGLKQQQKKRWFFERHPKTSLFLGCVASLSLGLLWPSIKQSFFKNY
jgi:hypothetical protein